MSRRFFEGLVLTMLVAAPGVLAAQDKPASQSQLGSDTFMAGSSVRLDQPVPGDLIAAGGNVDVDAPVAGDAVLVGGNLRVTAKVEQDIYVAGGRVILDAPIGHNLRVAGGQVEIGPMAEVGGNVTIGGGRVTLRGPIKGALRVAGGRVLLDGPVAGDVESTSGRLTLGPNARLAGKLRYRSREELTRDPAAQVAGAVERVLLPGLGASSPAGEERGRGRADSERFVGPGWFWTLGLMAIAAVLVAALPVTSLRVADNLRNRPGWSLLWGFIALVCIPVAALILLISIIGIPLALLALLLYGMLLLVGYVASGIALGQWSLARLKADASTRKGWRIASAVAAIFALALLGSVPFAGGFVALAAVLAGIGAIALLLAPDRPKPGLPPAAP
jgi:cytoskeletal protein CcmA (bactofilin family)